MNKESIKVELIDIVSRLFEEKCFEADMIEYADLISDLGMDSITFITAIVQIEERFRIEFPDNMVSMDNFRKVDGIVKSIEFLLKESPK